MSLNETQLKKHLNNKDLAKIYFLYGDEPYLTAYYAKYIASKASDNSPLAEFNQQSLDGTECTVEDIEESVEALPVMADRKSVSVRDFDVSKTNAGDQKRLIEMISDLPSSCVLVFWQDTVDVNLRRNAKWREFEKKVKKAGVAAQLNQRTENQLISLLAGGAKRRDVELSQDNARLMIHLSGNDMTLLLGELEKLCAAAQGDNIITKELIMGLGVKNLEASVYDLSNALLSSDSTKALGIIHMLFANNESPVMILSTLSGAFVDLYRAKISVSAGVRAESLASDFSYRGREWVLRNAARNSRNLSVETLRKCLDCLANADKMLKSTSIDQRVVLEQTIAGLILLTNEG